MKHLNAKTIAMATLAVTAVLWAAPAARAEEGSMRFEIPFSFVAGKQVLPAGSYDVTVDQHFARLLLRNREQGGVHAVPMGGVSASRTEADANTARLRFTRYSGTLYLTEAFARGQEDGRSISTSRQMMEARSGGASGAAAESVTLSAPLK